MKVSIITIGDEILIGQIVDTNSAWIAKSLNKIGLDLSKIYSISDSESVILRTLNRAKELSDIVIITGGLGPTNDDITKHTLVNYFNDKLVRNQEVLVHIKQLFKKFGVQEINKLNEQQADLPSKCKVLFNELGTAPGMWFEKDNKHFISMPGVPFEMKYLMNTHVLPELQSRFSEIVIVHKTILTQGVPESILADIIATWEMELPSTIKLAYLPSEGRVRLRLSTRGKDKELLNLVIDEQIEKLKLIIPKLIFGEENDTLEQRIGQELLRVNASIGSAESCTGGYVAHLITLVSGASAYFKGSVLAYNAAVKQAVLGVQAKTIADYGVVSKQVAEEMALGVQQLMKVDYAIATTGIAGPLGGSIDNPVGTIWTSVATPIGVQSVKYQLGTERVRNIKRSSTAVLLDLLHILERVDKKGE
ncbi:MAG: CinA family nicotinamide mononucleotide deamidase-related protein [Flavobacteriales bacterium]|nr:CinA family nicotinamide mononucleotide deamidase-related protein [Flavobacteriales bacterium]MDG1396639.1 CinA family nicotinamide mononucleotide deamidase-related protein [Flavobacteriales bacterium]